MDLRDAIQLVNQPPTSWPQTAETLPCGGRTGHSRGHKALTQPSFSTKLHSSRGPSRFAVESNETAATQAPLAGRQAVFGGGGSEFRVWVRVQGSGFRELQIRGSFINVLNSAQDYVCVRLVDTNGQKRGQARRDMISACSGVSAVTAQVCESRASPFFYAPPRPYGSSKAKFS